MRTLRAPVAAIGLSEEGERRAAIGYADINANAGFFLPPQAELDQLPAGDYLLRANASPDFSVPAPSFDTPQAPELILIRVLRASGLGCSRGLWGAEQ